MFKYVVDKKVKVSLMARSHTGFHSLLDFFSANENLLSQLEVDSLFVSVPVHAYREQLMRLFVQIEKLKKVCTSFNWRSLILKHFSSS